MAEYTPTTREVRRVYSRAPENLVTGGKPNPNPGYAGAQFDRWLAAVVAAAKAEAWDEGWRDGQRSDFSENPYVAEVGGENR